MAPNSQAIKCKSCTRILATVSDTGLVPSASATEASNCNVCEQFSPLYDAMKAADEQLACFSERRDNYRPKQDALVNVKKTHMDFDNWLMGVEATPEGNGRVPHEAEQDHQTEREVGGEESRGTKRSLSPSQSQSPTSTAPTSRLSTHTLPEGKRLKFSNSVEFREDYRPCELYSRNGEAYVPGRYAAAEGVEHLDTSGSVKTFLKFTGMKRVGKEWVDVWKEDEEEDGEESKKKTTYTRKTSAAAVDSGGASLVSEEEMMPSETASTDARAQRLARRSSATSEITTLPRTNTSRRNQAKVKLPAPSRNAAMTGHLIDTINTIAEGAAKTHVGPTMADTDDDGEKADCGNVAHIALSDGPIRQVNEARDRHRLVVCDRSAPTVAKVDNAVTVRGIVESHPAGNHHEALATADDKGASDMDRQPLGSPGRENAALPSQRQQPSIERDEPQEGRPTSAIASANQSGLQDTRRFDAGLESRRSGTTTGPLRNSCTSGHDRPCRDAKCGD
jgi:hypothetical protein